MSFIVRNLGWILLLIFFLFMLFVISISGKNRTIDQNNVNKEVGSVVSDEPTSLDILEEKVSEEGKVNTQEDEEIKQDNEEKDSKNDQAENINEDQKEIQNDTQSFLSRIFGNGNEDDNTEDKEDEEESEMGNEEEMNGDTEEVIEEESNEVSTPDDSSKIDTEVSKQQETQEKIPTKTENKNVEATKVFEELFSYGSSDSGSRGSSAGYVKSIPNTKPVSLSHEARIYLSESGVVLPGVHIEPKIGNIYQIGVHALKLNNKYFTQTLGYLNKNDTLKQTTNANRYGCFEIEIINSPKSYKIGKKGYVCKKWLNDISSSHSESPSVTNTTSQVKKEVTITEGNTPSFTKTAIGDTHTITFEVMQDGVLLEVGDVLDQMSEMNVIGCFTAMVRYSQNGDKIGKVIKACSPKIYK